MFKIKGISDAPLPADFRLCSSYRKNSDVCSAHYIREKVVEQIVLESMQRILLNVQAFEKEFARKQMDCYTEDKKKQLASKRLELSKAKKRIAEIDALIQKIYGDNASGKLSDKRYATLSLRGGAEDPESRRSEDAGISGN